jgi:glucosamine--fructose-6-phosphate aminotransferase (isomerizing)
MNIDIPEWLRPVFERERHPFHVWDELMKTADCLRTVLADEVLSSIRKAAASMAGVSSAHFVGCGSSYFSGIAGSYLFNGKVGIPAFAYNAFEFSAYPPAVLAGSAVIGISHTGGTAVVMDSLALAAKHKAVTVGLTDVDESPLAKSADHVIQGGGGREKPMPKTRSFSVSLLKHYLLAAEVAQQRGKQMEDVHAELLRSPETAQQVLDDNLALSAQIASELTGNSKIYLFGAGPNTACVMDGTLKFQEMVQANAFAFELEEGMHGPWVTMEPEDLVVVFTLKGPSYVKAKNLIAALAPVGVKIWLLSDDPDGIPGAAYKTRLPQVPECISPLYSILPVYELVYHLALVRGIRPDAMRLTDERYLKTRLTLPR